MPQVLQLSEERQHILDNLSNKSNMMKYQRVNDAFLTPDSGFRKQLHALDSELEVVWDYRSSKWNIYRFPKNGKEPFHMMTVQTKDRTYRDLGTDILLKLQESDPWRFSSLKQLTSYFDEMDKQTQRRKQRDFLNRIKDIRSDIPNKMRGIPQVQVPKSWDALAIPIQGKAEPVMNLPIISLPHSTRVRRVLAE